MFVSKKKFRTIIFSAILVASSCSKSVENARKDNRPDKTPKTIAQLTQTELTREKDDKPEEEVLEKPSSTVTDVRITEVDPYRDGWQVLVPKRKEPGNIQEASESDGNGRVIRKFIRTYSNEEPVVLELSENRTGAPQLDDLFQVGTVMEIGSEDSVYAYTLFIRGAEVDHDSDSTYEHSRSHSIPLQIVDREGNGRFIVHYGGPIQIPDWVLRKKRQKEEK